MTITNISLCDGNMYSKDKPHEDKDFRLKYSCKFPHCRNGYYLTPNHFSGQKFTNKHFYQFPKERVTRSKWKKICGVPPDVKCDNFNVCEDHFLQTDFMNLTRHRLKMGVVPKHLQFMNTNSTEPKQNEDMNVGEGRDTKNLPSATMEVPDDHIEAQSMLNQSDAVPSVPNQLSVPQQTGSATTLLSVPQQTGSATTLLSVPQQKENVTTLLSVPQQKENVTTLLSIPQQTKSATFISVPQQIGCSTALVNVPQQTENVTTLLSVPQTQHSSGTILLSVPQTQQSGSDTILLSVPQTQQSRNDTILLNIPQTQQSRSDTFLLSVPQTPQMTGSSTNLSSVPQQTGNDTTLLSVRKHRRKTNPMLRDTRQIECSTLLSVPQQTGSSTTQVVVPQRAGSSSTQLSVPQQTGSSTTLLSVPQQTGNGTTLLGVRKHRRKTNPMLRESRQTECSTLLSVPQQTGSSTTLVSVPQQTGNDTALLSVRKHRRKTNPMLSDSRQTESATLLSVPQQTGNTSTLLSVPQQTGITNTLLSVPQQAGNSTILLSVPQQEGSATTLSSVPEIPQQTGNDTVPSVLYVTQGILVDVTSQLMKLENMGKQIKPKKVLAPKPTEDVIQKKRKLDAGSVEVPTVKQEAAAPYNHDRVVSEDTSMEYDCEGEDRLIEPENMGLLCRLCASSSEVVVPVFEDKNSTNCLLEKIHTYLPILITRGDPLPKTVCKECVNRLEICHKLVHGCLEAEVTLKNMLRNASNKSSKSVRRESRTSEQYEQDERVEVDVDAHVVETLSEDYQEQIERSSNCNNLEETQVNNNVRCAVDLQNGSYIGQVAEMGVFSEESTEVQYLIPENINVEEVHIKEEEESAGGSVAQMKTLELCAANDLQGQKQGTSEIVKDKLIRKKITEKKKGKKDPKFKVIIVKVKNGMDVTQSEEFRKSLASAINAKAKKKTQKRASNQEVEVKENVTPDHTYTSSQHSCTMCPLIFQNRESLVLHQAAIHQSKIFYCRLCHTFYDSNLDLEEHSRTLHGQPRQSDEKENIDQSSESSVSVEIAQEGAQEEASLQM